MRGAVYSRDESREGYKPETACVFRAGAPVRTTVRGKTVWRTGQRVWALSYFSTDFLWNVTERKFQVFGQRHLIIRALLFKRELKRRVYSVC